VWGSIAKALLAIVEFKQPALRERASKYHGQNVGVCRQLADASVLLAFLRAIHQMMTFIETLCFIKSP